MERREQKGKEKRKGESTPKIGSNKLSTIFAGLNTLKRLEIRRAGGPFVHGVPADRATGMKDCNVLSAPGKERRTGWKSDAILRRGGYPPAAEGTEQAQKHGREGECAIFLRVLKPRKRFHRNNRGQTASKRLIVFTSRCRR